MRAHGERRETGVPHQLVAIHGYDHGRVLKAMPGALAQRDDAEEREADERQPQCAEVRRKYAKSREGKKSENMIYDLQSFFACAFWQRT